MGDLSNVFLSDAKYKLTSLFGYRSTVGLPSGASAYHNGVDYSLPEGSRIGAYDGGKVIKAGFNKAKGNFVQVQHDGGLVSEYEHMKSYAVKVGDAVQAGGLLGYVGSTGISTGSHLHLGLMQDGKYINPLSKTQSSSIGSASSLQFDGVSLDNVTGIIKNYWYLFAGGLVLFAIFSKR